MERSLAVIYFITRAKSIKAIALAREHLTRQGQAVGHLAKSIGLRNAAIQLAKFIVHKADIERCVMDDQLRAADVIEKLIDNIAKHGLIHEEFVRNTVDAKSFRVHQAIRLKIDVEVVPGQAAVDHLYRADLDYLMPLIVRTNLIHTGGFGIENDLSCNCSAHSGHLCQTYRFTYRFQLQEVYQRCSNR